MHMIILSIYKNKYISKKNFIRNYKVYEKTLKLAENSKHDQTIPES